MRLGLALPQYDYTGRVEWAAVVGWAQAAEARGFDSVWLADHPFMTAEKYGGPPGVIWGYEPITALGALSQAVGRVHLGTLVVCAGLRPPAITGKLLAGVDVVSDGRLVAGVGAGWFEAEYREAGVAFG